MKNSKALEKQTLRQVLLLACAAALAVAFMAALLQPAYADNVQPPPVPADLRVPAGNVAFLVGHAVGTQNYICLPSGSGFAFRLFTPQATLFKNNDKQIITHFFSPNPDENGTIRAAWQDSEDTSTVWAMVAEPKHSSSDPDFVEPGAIAWLKLTRIGSQEGTHGGDRLGATTFIQRLNTSGGVAPATGCASAGDIGQQRFVPYKADYFFYREAGGQ